MENGNTARKLTDEELAMDRQTASEILSLEDRHYLSEETRAAEAQVNFQRNFLQTILTAEHLLIDTDHPHHIEVGGLVDEITPDFLEDLRLQFAQWKALPDSPTKLEMFLHLEDVRTTLNHLMGGEKVKEKPTEDDQLPFDALEVDIDDFF